MPRLEGGTNNTSKIAMVVAGVVIAAGVAWFALRGNQPSDELNNGATPTRSASPAGSEAGSPPPPPDANTTALPDNTTSDANGTGAGAIESTPAANAMDSATPMSGGANNALGGTSSMQTPNAMTSPDAMTTPSEMGTPGVMMTPSTSRTGAGVTMTPAGAVSGRMNAPAARVSPSQP